MADVLMWAALLVLLAGYVNIMVRYLAELERPHGRQGPGESSVTSADLRTARRRTAGKPLSKKEQGVSPTERKR